MEKLSLKAKKIKSHNLRKVLPFYFENNGLISLLIILMVVAGVLGIFQPIFSANALATLAQGEFNRAIKFLILMCSLGLGRILFNGIIEALYIRVNSKTKMEITKKIVDAISDIKMKKLDSIKLGHLTERISTDVSSVSRSYLDMINLFFDILTNVVFLGYIAYLNLYLFLILMVYVFVLYFVCVIRSRVWIRGMKIMKKLNDEARSAYIEQINGIRDVKLLNIRKSIINYSNKKYEDALKMEIKINDKRNFMRRAQGTLSIIFELIFLIVGIIFIRKDMILITGLLVIYTYYGRVEGLVNYLSQYKEFKADGEIAASRIFEVIGDYEKENFGTEELINFSGNIKLENVNFSYDGKTQILKNISMNFHSGKMTAIVGKSGSGKTTILNIISKLYDIDSGNILFDDKSIDKLNRNSIRENVGEISQSPYIFNTSIRQNMLFAKPNATEKEIIKVLKDAEIYDDVKNMPSGIDSEIGENGIKVSGGQKQRLAIARLLLKNPKVIVLDEATSSLDNESQKKIINFFEKNKRKKTIIIVAHRLSSIINADKIYIIDDGKIIANGTHNNLMKTCKEYKKLYEVEQTSLKMTAE